MREVARGSKTALNDTRYTVAVECGVSSAGLIDVIAVALGPGGRVRGDDDVVFFNNRKREGMVLTDGSAVEIDLDALSCDVERVVVAGSTEAQSTTFGAAPGLVIAVRGSSEEFRFAPPGLSSETVLQMVAFYRRAGSWRLDAVGQGYADGLSAFARDHGIDVADEPAHPRDPAVGGMAETSPAHSEGEHRWVAARERDDLDAMIEMLIDADDRGDLPEWLEKERHRLWLDVVTRLEARLDDDDTRLGYQAIRLSSADGTDGTALALLGLASVCMQAHEQEGDVNIKIPSLLHAQLTVMDALPRADLPDFVLAWRELAVRRVEILVRLSHARKVNALREAYLESVRMAELIHVYEPAATHLARIRRTLPVLRDAYRDLEPYRALLEHVDERRILDDELDLLSGWIEAGVDALNIPRR